MVVEKQEASTQAYVQGLWKERNARTFNGQSSSPARLALKIQDEAKEWCLVGYRHLLSVA